MEILRRFIDLDRILRESRRPVSKASLLDRLECSESSFKRLRKILSEEIGYSVVYDRKQNGYYLDTQKTDQQFAPGLHFSDSEIYALMVSQQLLSHAQAGPFSDELKPLKESLNKLLEKRNLTHLKRCHDIVCISPIAYHPTKPLIFQNILTACQNQLRINMVYIDISQRATERVISPQRLLYYRDNWYLEAWCHERDAIRLFMLAAIQSAVLSKELAKKVDIQQLNRDLQDSYGIFSGKADKVAHLLFSKKIAMRIYGMYWHPNQIQNMEECGSVSMTIPYGDERELVRDVLRWMPDVKVVSPLSLKKAVIDKLQQAIKIQYDDGSA